MGRRLVAELTLGGKLSYRAVRRLLTPEERLIAARLRQRPDFPDDGTAASDTGRRVTCYRFGHRIGLAWPADRVPEGSESLLQAELDPEGLAGLEQRIRHLDARQQELRREGCRRIRELRRGGRLRGFLDDLQDTLRHMPPLIAFVKDRCYTSLQYIGANLLDRRGHPGLLTRLGEISPEQWCREDLDFVFACFLWQTTGPYFKLEELNSSQLDPWSMDEMLKARLRRYRRLAGLPGDLRPAAVSLLDKAARVRQLEERILEQKTRYRTINGLSLHKEIRFFTPVRAGEEAFPAALATSLRDRFPLPCAPSGADLRLAERARLALESDRVEELLLLLLDAGLQLTRADFFLSRGPRVLGVPANASELQNSDFYCAVIARPGFDLKALGVNNGTEEARWRQAKRMQFNSWKFWHGALDREERAPDQYYFYPPQIPDLARLEDQLHSGHRANGVAQSLRSPGALSLFDPVRGTRRCFHAVYDTRAVRSSERPRFTPRDLRRVIVVRLWVGEVLQAFCDMGAEGGRLPRIDGFGPAFYGRASGPGPEP